MSVVSLLTKVSNCGEKDIFTGTTRQLKWRDEKRIIEVKNFDDALKAIELIVDQGEGASPYNPLQQNVGRSELSHYYKFSTIFHGNKITVSENNNGNLDPEVSWGYCVLGLYS